MKTLAPLVVFAALLFTGCAGYNHTLFMTKSNAGLDFDTKPPTLELSIGRKGAVISPSFEAGKTPPVMASFKPRAGSNSFFDFFVGVDQTFAGGDAALAMSKLYGEPDSKEDFESRLELNKPPKYTDFFRKLAGPGESRPFIVGTDTLIGTKVAWNGTGGQMPDTVKMGFSRKEFAWAPITVSTTGSKTYVKMPAFLATVDSSQAADGDSAEVEALQYFATGEAATNLAKRQDVRSAMLARLDPNTDSFKSRFASPGLAVLPDILFSIETLLKRFKSSGDTLAGALLDKLDSLAGLNLPANYRNTTIPGYTYAPATFSLSKNVGGQLPIGGTDLSEVTAYLTFLDTSQINLKAALAAIEAGNSVTLGGGAITTAQVPALAIDLASLKERSDTLKATPAANPYVGAADRYVQARIANN